MLNFKTVLQLLFKGNGIVTHILGGRRGGDQMNFCLLVLHLSHIHFHFFTLPILQMPLDPASRDPAGSLPLPFNFHEEEMKTSLRLCWIQVRAPQSRTNAFWHAVWTLSSLLFCLAGFLAITRNYLRRNSGKNHYNPNLLKHLRISTRTTSCAGKGCDPNLLNNYLFRRCLSKVLNPSQWSPLLRTVG